MLILGFGIILFISNCYYTKGEIESRNERVSLTSTIINTGEIEVETKHRRHGREKRYYQDIEVEYFYEDNYYTKEVKNLRLKKLEDEYVVGEKGEILINPDDPTDTLWGSRTASDYSECWKTLGKSTVIGLLLMFGPTTLIFIFVYGVKKKK